MSHRSRATFLAGLTIGLLLTKATAIYRQRTRARIPSPEGIEVSGVAEAFGRIAELPQMRLLRGLVTWRALRLCRAGHAADLGCGAGQLAVELAQAAPDLHITGVDLSNLLLGQALHRAAAAGLAHRVDFRTGDVGATPFETGTLDLVVSTLSLHHWANPAAVLSEVARILRPGGAFVIFDLRRDMVAPLYMLLWLVTHYVVPRALRRAQEPLGSRNAAYTPAEAAELARASKLTGWRVVHGPFWISIEGRTILDTYSEAPAATSVQLKTWGEDEDSQEQAALLRSVRDELAPYPVRALEVAAQKDDSVTIFHQEMFNDLIPRLGRARPRCGCDPQPLRPIRHHQPTGQ